MQTWKCPEAKEYVLAGLPGHFAWDRDPDCRVGEEGELCFGFETVDGGAEECEDVCCAVEGESCDEIVPGMLSVLMYAH